MATTNKLSVGQTVWYRTLHNTNTNNNTLVKSEIASVGNKYFELKERELGKFYIDTLKQNCGNYVSRYQVYLSEQDFADEQESKNIQSELQRYFSAHHSNFSLEKLRQILAIVKS